MKARLLALTFLALAFLALAPLSATTRAQDVAVEQTMKFTIPSAPKALDVAGEVQSTVIPPGTVNQCNEGRLLVSVDPRRPPTTGLVLSRRLDALSDEGGTVEATFDLPPNPDNYSYVTNDHDLVTLPNGDVFYLTGAGSKAPLDEQKNPWFKLTTRDNFGPGHTPSSWRGARGTAGRVSSSSRSTTRRSVTTRT